MAAEQKQMDPVFLIIGEDELKRESMVKRLLSRFQQMGDSDFNTSVFFGSASNAQEILASCNTVPFLSPSRLVLVKDADKLGSNDQKKLADYLASPFQSTVLALVAPKLLKTSALYKAVDKNYPKSIIDCSPKGKKDLPELLAKMASTYGVSIAPRAASLLISYVGDSTLRLDAELKKLSASKARGACIDTQDVERMVVATVESKPWDFADALMARDAIAFERALSRSSDSPISILAICVSRIRELLICKSLEARAEPGRLAQELGKQDWQVRGHRSAASRFTSSELISALSSAAQCEKGMKSGADPKISLELWALGVCSGR